jgi:selenocysteine lyase/cysteine desulfurase
MRQVHGLFAAHEEALSARFLDFANAHPRIRLIGKAMADHDKRAPTFSFTVDGMASQDVPPLLEARGIACGAGDFYAPRVLKALGIDPADGVVRCSMVHYNTVAEADRLVAALDTVV